MTAVLIVVTLASLALAGALLVYVLKLSRDERDRSEARAVALAELLDAQVPAESRVTQEVPEPDVPAHVADSRAVARVQAEPASTDSRARTRAALPVHSTPGAARDSAPVASERPSAWNAFETETSNADAAPMFGSAAVDDRNNGPRWLVVPAIGVLIVGLALTAVYVWNRPPTPAPQTAEASSRPLELVTLRHQRQGDTLVITGLVRNPPDATATEGLVAVAFAFDKQGTFLMSGRSVLDFPQLKAGEESPFSITIPQAGGVGRYRVSFRTDAGIVPHVDRRSAAPAAVQQAAAQ